MADSFLSEIIFIIIAAFVGGFCARSLKLPPVLGYIVSGVMFGIVGKSFFASYDSLVVLSQVGVSLLLFTLGFEITLDTILKIKKKVFIVGILNVVLVSLVLIPLLTVFGIEQNVAILFSILFSFSSTAVIVKILGERGLLANYPGSNVFIYLLIQDLFIVPVIFLLPILFSDNSTTPFSFINFILSSARPLVLFALIMGASKLILPKFLNLVFRYPSHELSILATIFTAAISIYLLTSVGLPASIAAFLAGVLISEQGKNLTPLAEIRPFRDLFLVLFFVMTGMLVNFGFLLSNLPFILGLSLLVVFVKFVVVYLLLRFSQNSPSSSVFISSHIANVGEFAIVIAQIAFVSQFITQKDYNLVLSVFILSLLFIPFLLKYFRAVFEKVAGVGIIGKFIVETGQTQVTPQDYKNHVVICGHGRVGRETASLLEAAGIPVIVVDFNKRVVEELIAKQEYAIYGDPTDEDILKAAFCETARALVIAVPDTFSQKRIINLSKKLNPHILIFARSHVEEDHSDLTRMGVTKIVMPEFEAGIKIGEEILADFQVDSVTIATLTSTVRNQHSLQDK